MYNLTKLDNGLRVLTVNMPHLKSVSLGFFVGVGSRYESQEMTGASHFIEHMLFKGTAKRPTARDIAEAIESKGGIFNASTSMEATLYWAKVAAPHLPEALDVLSDMLLNATFCADAIEKERVVINEEISYSLDAPDSLAQLRVNSMQWPNHPLGRDIAGTVESVAGLGRDDLLDYLSAHYRPGATILGVAGNAEHDELVSQVEELLGDWKPGPEMSYEPAPKGNGPDGPNVHLENKDIEQTQLSLSFSGVARNSPERFTVRMLNILLGEGMRSRLFQEVRERLGLAYHVGSFITALQDTGAVGLYAGVAAERTDDTIRAILDQIDLLRQQPVPEDELQAACDFIGGRMALGLEDSFALAAWYTRQELLEDGVLELEEALDGFARVQAADIQRLAQELFQPERLNLAIVGPFSENGDHFRKVATF